MISVTKKPLTKSQQARRQRVLPNDLPKYVRCYDNGGVDKKDGSVDRYTVVFTGRYSGRNGCEYLGMSGAPFHPQGVGQHGWNQNVIDRPKYSHLGKRIKFFDLPRDCQVCVMRDYLLAWRLSNEDDCYRDAVVIVDARIKAAEAVPI